MSIRQTLDGLKLLRDITDTLHRAPRADVLKHLAAHGITVTFAVHDVAEVDLPEDLTARQALILRVELRILFP